jgi:hypothetical protein
MLAVKSRYPHLHAFLQRDLAKGTLTWETFAQTLSNGPTKRNMETLVLLYLVLPLRLALTITRLIAVFVLRLIQVIGLVVRVVIDTTLEEGLAVIVHINIFTT